MLAAALTTGLLVLGLGPGAERFFRPPPDETREILAQPDRIETFSIAPVIEKIPYAGAPGTIGGHHILAAGRVLRGKRALRIARLLLDEDSYRVGAARDFKTCDFLPRHALRFFRGDRSTDVLLCFSCTQLTFESGGGDFDPVAADLHALVGDVTPAEEPAR